MGVKHLLSTVLSGTRLAPRLPSRANRVAPVLGGKWEQHLGLGQSWAPLSYGEYYPRSALVHSGPSGSGRTPWYECL